MQPFNHERGLVHRALVSQKEKRLLHKLTGQAIEARAIFLKQPEMGAGDVAQ